MDKPWKNGSGTTVRFVSMRQFPNIVRRLRSLSRNDRPVTTARVCHPSLTLSLVDFLRLRTCDLFELPPLQHWS